MTRWRWVKMTVILGLSLCTGCGCETEDADDMAPAAERFAHMEQADLVIGGETFRAWVARDASDISSGLMFVQADEMTPYADGAHKSMLFVFESQRRGGIFDGFWMKNVPISLDIAFIDADGKIVSIKTMAAFDTRSTTSDAPYRYALETSAGLFKRLDITAGDVVQFPDGILNHTD